MLSCKSERKQNDARQKTVPEVKLSKLEQLYLLPTDSVLNFYDLSNDSITEFPDLSAYRIRSLDLSYNLIDTAVITLFPQGIEVLNLSNNKLSGIFYISLNSMKERDSYTLKEMNVSYNKLYGLSVSLPLYRIIASHNDITYVDFNHKNIQYLDISYNPNLSNQVNFTHSLIDTIVRDGIANDKPLRSVRDYPIVFPPFRFE